MKHTRRIIALLLAVLMLLSGAAVALAATPDDGEANTTAYVKTVRENSKVNQSNAGRFILAANILMDMDEEIDGTLTEKVLTGQNVIGAINGMIEAISKKMESDPTFGAVASYIKFLFTTQMIASGLDQDAKFAGAVEKLQKANTDGYLTVPDIVENEVEFTSADFGFADGDAYGFFDAIICSLSDILSQLGIRDSLGDFTDSEKNGEYVVGNYDLFIPVYELLETNPMSSAEFTQAVAKAGDTNNKTRLRTVANLTLKPVADLLTRVETGGLNTVLDLLPKLLYALDSGMVNDLVKNLLKDKTLLYMIQFNDLIAEMNINTDVIWNTIDKNFITGTEAEPAGFDFDKDEVKETTLPLTKEQFDAVARELAFAADPIVKSSVSYADNERLALKTDIDLVNGILCDAVVEFLESKDGADFARKAADSLEKSSDKWFVNTLISMLQSNAGRFLLSHTQGIIAAFAPIAARIIKIVNFFSIVPALK